MIYNILIDMVDGNPWQTREAEGNEEYLQDLASDIRKNGLLQTPVGRLVDEHGHAVTNEHFASMGIATDNSFIHLMGVGFRVQLAFGHNRLAAYRLLIKKADELTYVRHFPVELRFLDDGQMAAFAWSENERRKDLTPMERARAVRKRIDSFGWTQARAAEELGLSRPTVANILRLLDLPEEIGAEVQSGALSERQAQALVPLADIPEEVRQAAEKGNYGYIKPSEIVEAARKGESSDQIRQRVKAVVENYSVLLTAAEWPLDYAFEGDGYRSAKCEECAFRMKRGEAQACTVKECFKAKSQAWGVVQLRLVSEQTGIPVLGDDEHPTDVWFSNDEKIRQAVSETTCEHKRLRVASWGLMAAEGVAVVCSNPAGECSCLKLLEKDQRENDPALKAQREIKAGLQKLYDEAGRKVGQALAEGYAPAWLALLQRLSSGSGNATWTAEQIRERIGRELVRPRFAPDNDLSQARRSVADLLQTMGLASPQLLTPADEAAKKFERIAEWMESLRDELPTAEAVRGNIANLEKLQPVVDEDLKGEVDDAHKMLCAVLGAISQPDWRAEEFHWVQDILENDDTDGGFESFVVDAPACAVRYVLAIVKEYPEYEYEAGILAGELVRRGDGDVVKEAEA